MSKIKDRLEALGLVLPEPAAPVAAYVPAKKAGGLLYVSGQLPFKDGEVLRGRLGADMEIEAGAEAARLCALMLLAQAKAAVGLSKIKGCVQLGGFVACTPEFTGQPKVVDGASTLMQEVLGDQGRHARFAVGAPSLPLGACVEVAGIFALD